MTLRFVALSAQLLIAIFAGSGCATTPLTDQLLNGFIYSENVRHSKHASNEQLSSHIPLTKEIVDTPFYPQDRYQCGPASLAAVLNLRGIETNPQALKDAIYLPDRKGSLQIEMKSAVRNFNLLAYTLSPSLEALIQEIAAGNPVIVLQNLSIRPFPVWHYATVIGYDLDQQFFTLRSGQNPRIKIRFSTFERTWRRANHWGLVIVTLDQIPASASDINFVKAAQDFENINNFSAAKKAYQTALTRWPDNEIALFGLGNVYYAEQKYSQAANAFMQLINAHPNLAAGWNNFGYALASNGCIAEAINAVECAITLTSANSPYLNSLVEIKALRVKTKRAQQCLLTNSLTSPSCPNSSF